MSTMAWYPLPQSGSAMSAGDEFFENQSAGWSLWSFSSSDDQRAAPSCSVKQESGGARSEEQPVPAPLEPHQCAHPTDEIFLSQFSDEDMRRMDAPFEALDMFPDSMHRLLSYEDMLSGVLTGNSSEDQDTELKLDRNGVDTLDTCGFPLFSHDLQNAEPDNTMDTPSMDKDGMGATKRSRSLADDESPRDFEALVLEELEDVVFLLTRNTRICFRDAFFRLAECSSKAPRCTGPSRLSVHPSAEGNASRAPAAAAAAGCPERGTNAIDRTVADLTMRPPCPAPLEVHGSCLAGGSGAAAQSTTGWTARA